MAEQIHITIGNSENPKDEDTDCNLETQPTDTEKDDANANLVTIKQVPNLPDTEPLESGLIHTKHEMLAGKDFSAEVRGLRDVESFLKHAVILLNVTADNTRHMLREMVRRLLEEHPKARGQCSEHEVLSACFTTESDSLVGRTIQGTTRNSDSDAVEFDQSWICIVCDLPRLSQTHMVVARLQQPTNLGLSCQEVTFVALILGPVVQKLTKSSIEMGRTLATLFTDLDTRHALVEVTTESQFKHIMRDRAHVLAQEQAMLLHRKSSLGALNSVVHKPEKACRWRLGQGITEDLMRRLPHYLSDYKDGLTGHKTPHKVLSATVFLYFACVLPNIAFGMLNSNNTEGAIGVKKVLFSQTLGGVLFAVLGGQPLIVLLTTAPLALYTKIIYNISEDFDLDFNAMFACVGLWNAFFLLLYSLFDVSKLMRWSSRSTEEIFSLFITFAFSADAIKDAIANFQTNYNTPACRPLAAPSTSATIANSTNTTTIAVSASLGKAVATALTPNLVSNGAEAEGQCLRENSLLFLLLMLGTVWLGTTLLNFTHTPFLTAGKREILADYALPIAVLLMSFCGSYLFRDIQLQPFAYNPDEDVFEMASLTSLPLGAVAAAGGLGFSLSLLFFMDQNISSALVNSPHNKLKKGPAYHWDLLVVAAINGFLSVFTCPWVHAALPHSPLHVRALADTEEKIDDGHVHQIVVHVRETRITGIVSHVLIGLSLLLLPHPLSSIPRAVLNGLFLYVAITALFDNQFFERILLLFTEQAAYPPTHYIRRVPQRKIHTFTLLQLGQLLVLCVFGFSPIPYMKMVFPLLLIFLLPIRHKLIPKLIEQKYLTALDGH